MKNLTIQNRQKYLFLLVFTLLIIQNASAQFSTFTLDAKVGSGFLIGSVSPLPGMNSSLTLRYAPSRLISVGVFSGAGILWGNGNADREKYSETGNTIEAYKEKFKFNTEYHTWGGSVYLNIQKLVNPENKPKYFIPYLFAGAGYLRARSESESMENDNHSVRYVTYYTNHIGFEVKIKGSKKIDYLISFQHNFTETAYLDGIPFDKKYDSFLNFNVGISYHLCFDKNKTPIDWTRRFCCPVFYR